MITKIKGSILVLSGACSFGILSTIVKIAYDNGYSLGEVIGSQTFIGMIVLWTIYLISFWRNKKRVRTHNVTGYHKHYHHKRKEKTHWWKLIGAGVFTGLVGVFYYKCVSLLPASVAIILLMQNVWITFLLESYVFKKKPTKMQLISMVIVLIATIFAAGVFENHVSLNIEGVVYGLLAAFSYSLFIITSGRLGNDLRVVHKSALMVTGACFIAFIIFPPLSLFTLLFQGHLLIWGVALALFGTIIPPFLFSEGVPMTGVDLGAILGAAELPVAVIASAFILKEYISFLQIIGVLAIIVAIVLSNLPKFDNNTIKEKNS